MMVAFLIGAAIGFLAGFEEAKTERRYEDADEGRKSTAPSPWSTPTAARTDPPQP